MAEAESSTLSRISYYRSQIYTAYLGINPLVTAAHPIFSIIERIRLSQQNLQTTELQPKIDHELKAFEARALSAQYDSETVLISRYLLSVALSEAIEYCAMPYKALPSVNNKATSDNNRFFEILNRVIKKPEIYLDLLELIYLCLSTGYKGESQNQTTQELDTLKNKLYEIIITFRQNKTPANKEKSNTQPPIIASSIEKSTWSKVVGLLLLVTISAYTVSDYLLSNVAKNYRFSTSAQMRLGIHG